MDEYESLSHTKWEGKYDVVFIPKCRRKTLYAGLRKHLGEVFRHLAQQKESRIEEEHLMSDHVHMLSSIPPKYAVSQVVGFIKGKSAIHLARVYGERERSFVATLLGARILRVHGGAGRGRNPDIHPATKAGRQTAGSVEPGTLSGHRRVAKTGGAATATRGRFERLNSKSPRLCRGIIYSSGRTPRPKERTASCHSAPPRRRLARPIACTPQSQSIGTIRRAPP